MAGLVSLPTLKLGSGGPAVNELQRLLVKHGMFEVGWLGRLDVNMVGPVTMAAVQRFQTQSGLPATGVVDDVTWSRLYVMAGEAKIVSSEIVNAQQKREADARIAAAAAAASQAAAASGAGPAQRPRGPSVLPKLLLFGAVTGIAFFAYRKMAARRVDGVDGVAFVDEDGEDNAGPAERVRPERVRPKRKRLAAREPSDVEDLYDLRTLNPKDKWGRKVIHTHRDPDTEEVTDVDPGSMPSVPLRLEADEKKYKNQRQYREDMKRLAWDRFRANNHPVDVVVRGTKRVLYSAKG